MYNLDIWYVWQSLDRFPCFVGVSCRRILSAVRHLEKLQAEMIMESPRRACVATCVTWNLRKVNSHIVSGLVAWQFAIAPISEKISFLFIIMFMSSITFHSIAKFPLVLSLSHYLSFFLPYYSHRNRRQSSVSSHSWNYVNTCNIYPTHWW